MNVIKICKTLSILLFEGVLVLAGMLVGMENQKNIIKQEEQAEVVTDIAVVNLDEGVVENDIKRFYSSELINLDESFYVAENLEAARLGINNGSYAAYILIPAEFSQNAISINSVPQKTALEFAINPNLREDVSRLAMANVKNFEITLNTNMSYMYVQAILEEFHNVQDQAGTIMANDSGELERILGIDPGDMLEAPVYEEIDWIEADIEETDYEGLYKNNSQIADDLYENYDDFAEDGMTAFEEIKENEIAVIEAMELLYQSLGEVDIETDDEGNIVYEDGLSSMETYVDEFETSYQQQLTTIKMRAGLEIELTPSPTITPSATPAGTVVPTNAPVATPTATVAPMSTPTPLTTQTPTPTATPTPLPELFEDIIERSLETVNEEIEQYNLENTEQIMQIYECLANIKMLAGDTNTTQTFSAEEEEKNTSELVKEGITETTPKPEKKEELESTPKPEEKEELESTPKPEEKEELESTPKPEEKEALESTPKPEEKDDVECTPTPEKTPENLLIPEGNGTEEAFVIDTTTKRTGRFTLHAIDNQSPEEPLTISEYIEQIELQLAEIQQIPALSIDDLCIDEVVTEELEKFVEEIEKLPAWEQEEYIAIFESEVLQVLQDEILAENTKIQEDNQAYMEVMEAYLEEVSAFDPYDYYDLDETNDLLVDFADNTYKIQEQSYTEHAGYLTFVDDTVDIANTSIVTLKENLETAYDGTSKNIQDEINLAKESREGINQANIAILGDFKEKLPYTRIGNLEYVQAYDFIVKPIHMSDASIESYRGVIFRDYDTLRNLLIGLAIIWGCSVFMLLSMTLKKSAKEEQE